MNVLLKMFVLVTVFSLPLFSFGVVFASSLEWFEVARYEGSAFPDIKEFYTEAFENTHEEWRIRWEYNAVGSSPLESVLSIQKSDELIVNSTGYSDMSDVAYIPGQQEAFTLHMTCINNHDYTIVIEGKVDSIPEFPTWTITPLVIVTALVGIIYKMKLNKTKQRTKQLF